MNKKNNNWNRIFTVLLVVLGMFILTPQKVKAKDVYRFEEIILGDTIEQSNRRNSVLDNYYDKGEVTVKFVVTTNGCVKFSPQNGKECEYYLFDGEKKLIGRTEQTGPFSMYLTAGTYYCNLSCYATGLYDYIDTSFTALNRPDNTTFKNAIIISGTKYQGVNYAKLENYYSFYVPYDCEAILKINSDDGFYGNLYNSEQVKLQNVFNAIKEEYVQYSFKPLLVYKKSDYTDDLSSIVLTKGNYYIGLSGMGEFTLEFTIRNKITSSNTEISTTPYVYSQTFSDLIFTPALSQSKNEVLIRMVGTDIADSYEIYRSTKKDSGYKLIKTIKNNANYTDYDYVEGKFFNDSYPVRHEYINSKDYYVYHFYDKKLSSNKAYYYRVKFTKNVNGVTLRSKPSSTKVYWTAPKKVKIRVSESYNKATWKKIKWASGYLVREKFRYFRGYNIFGKRLYGSNDEVTRTNKTSYKKTAGKWHLKVKKAVSVIPYVKHGNYYYINGYHVISKKEMKKLTMDLQDTDTYSMIFGN